MPTYSRPVFIGFKVRDVQRAADFYREAIGIPVHTGEGEAHEEYSWVDPYFHFALFPKEADEPCFGLTVPDLKSAHLKAVAAGAKVIHPPKERHFGYTARYEDPDGNQIELTEMKRPSRVI